MFTIILYVVSFQRFQKKKEKNLFKYDIVYTCFFAPAYNRVIWSFQQEGSGGMWRHYKMLEGDETTISSMNVHSNPVPVLPR